MMELVAAINIFHIFKEVEVVVNKLEKDLI